MDDLRFPVSVTFCVPMVILVIVFALAHREWQNFRAPQAEEIDFFPYTPSRLVRRMLGLVVLASVALTLASLGRWPPQTAELANRYFVAFFVELAALGVILMADLWALARTRPRRRHRQPVSGSTSSDTDRAGK